MDYQWDKNKEHSNREKHGIAFADATAVFADDHALTLEDDHPDEERFVTIGMDGFGRILVVVYTWRGERIRIISARKAIASEIAQYEEWR
jgi:uncharacterized DUF497 family protein